MSRPPLEVADLIRSAGAGFIERNRQWLSWKHIKVLLALHGVVPLHSAVISISAPLRASCHHLLHSCRNRHCPKCQIAARERWIAARRRELSPDRATSIVVFTLPPQLAPLALQNKKVIYDLTVPRKCRNSSRSRSRSETPRRGNRFFTVLHTWNQKLGLHPHVPIASFPPVACHSITRTG